ncbi:SDR family NAD(P)-dependent oxidoreductase [Streptomyces sp. NPDC049879]|uniref:SDR family NAD(P)-dependent oxidoreductase n=1 Tax=Streptomyces sp. NPDC049879 TaxID=3365598 RepID=UPI0037B51CE9
MGERSRRQPDHPLPRQPRCHLGDGRRQWGRIINVSSVNARAERPGLTAYSTAKAGTIGFSRSLARERGPHGICVNTVVPGAIQADAETTLPCPSAPTAGADQRRRGAQCGMPSVRPRAPCLRRSAQTRPPFTPRSAVLRRCASLRPAPTPTRCLRWAGRHPTVE